MKKFIIFLIILFALSSIAYASETFGDVSAVAQTTVTPTPTPTPTPAPATTSSSSSGGSSGGGSGRGYSFSSKKETIKEGESVQFNLTTGLRYSFRVANTDHTVYLSEKRSDSVTIVVRSVAQTIELSIGQNVDVDLNQDGKNDVKIKFLGFGKRDAQFMMTRLGAPIEQVPTPYTAVPTPVYVEPVTEQAPVEPVEYVPESAAMPEPAQSSSSWWPLTVFFILIIAAMIAVWHYRKKMH